MRHVSWLLAPAILATSTLAVAAEWRDATGPRAHVAAATPEAAAHAYLADRRGALGLDGVDLRLDRTLASGTGGQVVRLDQRVAGLRVVGKGVVVHVGRGREVLRTATDVIDARGFDPTPAIDVADAIAAASDAAGRALPTPVRTELVVLPYASPRLAWMIDVRDARGGMRHVVDAKTGEVVQRASLAVDALGRVYEKNAVETPDAKDVELTLLDAAEPQRLVGWGGLLSVARYVSGNGNDGFELEQTLEPSSGVDFLYDPPADPKDKKDAFAEVNLFHHLSVMRQFFTGLGVEQTDPKWKLTAVANALENGKPLDNAFFSSAGQAGNLAAPNLIAIGQGTVTDFATDADVFDHEFVHYLTSNAVGYNLGQLYTNSYGLQPHSGSIDEGVADYFACTVVDDAELGEGSLQPLGAMRDLRDTSKRCPDDLLGEVHYDGEIAGSVAWSIREALGAKAADAIVWSAIAAMPPGGTFDDFAHGLSAATKDLVAAGELDAAATTQVEAVLAARGLDDCGEILALAKDGDRRFRILGLDMIGQAFGASCAEVQGFGLQMQSLFQFSVKPGVDAEVLRFTVDATAVGPGDVALHVYARKAKHVGFDQGAGGLPVVGDFDEQVEVTGATGEIVLPGPFKPGETWFFAVTSSSCPMVKASVRYATTKPPVGAGGAGGAGGGASAGGAAPTGAGGAGGAVATGGAPTTTAAAATPKDAVITDGGCDCRAGAGAPATSWGAGALAALGIAATALRRRRRAG